jgi:hypothetical protein
MSKGHHKLNHVVTKELPTIGSSLIYVSLPNKRSLSWVYGGEDRSTNSPHRIVWFVTLSVNHIIYVP